MESRGFPLGDLLRDERGYLEWLLRQDFPEAFRAVIGDALDGVLPVRFGADQKPDA